MFKNKTSQEKVEFFIFNERFDKIKYKKSCLRKLARKIKMRHVLNTFKLFDLVFRTLILSSKRFVKMLTFVCLFDRTLLILRLLRLLQIKPNFGEMFEQLF